MTHISADVPAVDNLLSRFRFTSYTALAEARVILAQQLRLGMQHTQVYQIPLTQQLPAEQGVENAAQYVHPWNIAAALVNVGLNGPRFGGAELAPQEDLLLYVDDWRPFAQLSFPTAVVPAGDQPAAIIEQPAPDMADPAGEALAPPSQTAAPEVAETPQDARSEPAEPSAGGLPSTDIKAERRGQTGRPQKSPFEKKIEERNKIAPPPFWWGHLCVSAPKIFTMTPAGALDDSSAGAGPVQSYMVLVALLRSVLRDVPKGVTVGDLERFLSDIDGQVARTETSAAANQLRKTLVAPR